MLHETLAAPFCSTIHLSHHAPPRTPSRTPPRPTALLFGWFASTPRNVSKYAAPFLHHGYNVAHVTAPLPVTYSLTPSSHARYVLSILSRVHAHAPHLFRGGLVVVAMSNGGAFLTTALQRLLSASTPLRGDVQHQVVLDAVRRSLAAVMFDSAPCYLHSHVAVRAIMEGLRLSGRAARAVVAVLLALFVWVQRVFVCDFRAVFWDSLRNADYGVPEVYVYSRADLLLDDVKLDALVKERKDNGKGVRVVRVEDAPHVMILKQYPEMYVRAVREMNEWGVNEYRKRVGLEPWRVEEEKNRQ